MFSLGYEKRGGDYGKIQEKERFLKCADFLKILNREMQSEQGFGVCYSERERERTREKNFMILTKVNSLKIIQKKILKQGCQHT